MPAYFITTLNIVSSVTYYLELHNAISFYYCFYEVKISMFYNVQTTYLPMLVKKMRYTLNSYTIA